MSNPDSSTPSIQARNLAVKPAGFGCWELFARAWVEGTSVHNLALAYAADLDKADKVGRMMLNDTRTPDCMPKALLEEARSMLLPDPIDPDLLEAREVCAERYNAPLYIGGSYDHLASLQDTLAGVRRGRELAKEQDRG